MMTPQLFINYKMKSVAHLPWRMLSYKFLNTFIDDIFAFVIKMPMMYRLGCFRDGKILFQFFLILNFFGWGPLFWDTTCNWLCFRHCLPYLLVPEVHLQDWSHSSEWVWIFCRDGRRGQSFKWPKTSHWRCSCCWQYKAQEQVCQKEWVVALFVSSQFFFLNFTIIIFTNIPVARGRTVPLKSWLILTYPIRIYSRTNLSHLHS